MEPKVRRLHSRANSLIANFEQGGGMSCIHKAIKLGRKALELCPPNSHMRPVSLNWLAYHLCYRHHHLKGTTDLDEGITLHREALELLPPGHPERWKSLINLVCGLSIRHQRLGALEDLEEAIVLNREALNFRPLGYLERLVSLNDLVVSLLTRYNQFGAMEDLDALIVLKREILDLLPSRQPIRYISMRSLADLSIQHKQLRANLHGTIVLDEKALNFQPFGSLNRFITLHDLAVHLFARYEKLGTLGDLEDAIVLDREALELYPSDHPDRKLSLNNLACFLCTRYQQLGALEDLEEAIVLHGEALESQPPGDLNRSLSLNSLTSYLSRYQQCGSLEDLNAAVSLAREALHHRPAGHPERWISLTNLAGGLSFRYQRLGEVEDLDEAIVLARDALNLHPQGHHNRHHSLNNLAVHLFSRYNQLGAVEDLHETIILDREALDLRLPGHPGRSMSLHNLAIHLSTQYERLGTLEVLEDAINLEREALDLRPPGHPLRSDSLNCLAVCLSTRHRQLRMMEDIDQAIVLHREALDLRPLGHPERWLSLNNLAVCFSTRYEQLGRMEDLNVAIALARDGLELCTPACPYRSLSLVNLANNLRTRFARTRQVEDTKAMFNLYIQLADVPSTMSSSDLSAAQAWVRVAEDFNHPTTLVAYETSLRLLVQYLAALPSLPHHLYILRSLISSLAMDAFSACIRNRAPVRAVELLEQGRGVFWTQFTRLRSPLDDVIVSGPAGKVLADEFTRLTSRIRNALNSADVIQQHGLVCHLNVELQRVVTSIRELPGLSHFLLPSLFSNLRRAASEGPVIIVNASKYSCDALVVLLDRDPVHIPLQITQEGVRDLSAELRALTERAIRADVTRQLAYILRKLWDQIVLHIVEVLQTTIPHHSRIWWCPTAEFSDLPLHAAGPYRKDQRNLSDLYISSYTPTLTALIHARRPSPSRYEMPQKRFVAIGQAKGIGEIELFSVCTELASIAQCIGGLTMFTHIEGLDSCVSQVAQELCKNEWVHLACHGLPNRKQPFKSAFALHDGHFTIEHIIRCDLENPEFVYLSACHTTVGDEESPDEVIHLASAMQFAGFRSVIGTMWAVDDGETNKITSTFYKHVLDESGRLDHTRAAYALNKTMKSANVPLDQRILYIHIGA